MWMVCWSSVVDLFLGQTASPHRDAVEVQDRADGAALDAVLITQLVDGGAGLVAFDQLLHLVVGESPGAAGLCPLRCRLGRCSQVRQLHLQCFQGADLVLCVRVSSPSLHLGVVSATRA
jgi:hypothetical protein